MRKAASHFAKSANRSIRAAKSKSCRDGQRGAECAEGPSDTFLDGFLNVSLPRWRLRFLRGLGARQRGRQKHAEGAARAESLRGNFCPPAVRFDHVAHDRQAQTEAGRRRSALRLHSVKPLEQVWQMLLR